MRKTAMLLSASLLLWSPSWATDHADAESVAESPRPRRVLVLGLDGLRGDALAVADTPALDRLVQEGAWTLKASTQLEARTVSAPGWTSIFTGVDSDRHGVSSNACVRRNKGLPSFLWHARNTGGFSVALGVNWRPILRIVESDARDISQRGEDHEVVDWMVERLREGTQDVYVVVLDDIDAAGHSTGFSPENPTYIEAIETMDRNVGAMWEVVSTRTDQEDWLVVMTSDHGGEGRGHGSTNAVCREVPLIVWGAGVQSGEISGNTPTQMDLFPTVLHFLEIKIEDSWGLAGRVQGFEVSTTPQSQP